MATETDNFPGVDLSIDLADADFDRLADLVHRHCGINLHDGKRELVRARLAKQMRAGGFRSARAYLEHATRDPASREFTQLIDALSTNLTSFFRENDHFVYLADRFLPGLVERRRKQSSRRIRAWSCASSTGEEPYSIAMTLCEAFGTLAPPASILATDVDTAVLDTAQRGIYPLERVEPVSPERLKRFFLCGTGSNEGYARVRPELARLVQFKRLNLSDVRWDIQGPFDAVFCRNVMIYFDKPTQHAILQRIARVLAPDGLLFAGHSESFLHAGEVFRAVGKTVYKPVAATAGQG